MLHIEQLGILFVRAGLDAVRIESAGQVQAPSGIAPDYHAQIQLVETLDCQCTIDQLVQQRTGNARSPRPWCHEQPPNVRAMPSLQACLPLKPNHTDQLATILERPENEVVRSAKELSLNLCLGESRLLFEGRAERLRTQSQALEPKRVKRVRLIGPKLPDRHSQILSRGAGGTMQRMSAEVAYTPLSPKEDARPYAELLSRAFATYPVMVRAFATASGERQDWVRRIGYEIVTTRQEMGLPCLAATLDGTPIGVALLSPSTHETPPEMRARFHRVLEAAGPDSIDFFRRFIEAVDSVEVPREHLWIAILAVDPKHQGKGIGRALIERSVAIARVMPDCVGLGLDTEDPKNVAIYRACGFEVVGEKGVDGMPVFVMWRPLETDR